MRNEPEPAAEREGDPTTEAEPPTDAQPDASVETASPAGRTGHPRVDAALEALERSSDLPPAEQIAEYEAVHRTLQETLATIDEGQS